MNCIKCGEKYGRMPVCKCCWYIPLFDLSLKEYSEKQALIEQEFLRLIAELPKKRQEFYRNRLIEMGLL
jgi:hypothetical protein